MLRTNLSTRPFYNDRAVKAVIALLVLVTGLLTAFNAAQALSLNQRNRDLVVSVGEAESKARDLRAQAQAVRQALGREELQAVQKDAREANLLIDRRTFSWTDLFNRFEETLPGDVRIVAVTPQVDREGRMLVAVSVVSRRADNLLLFCERMEATGAFKDFQPRQQETLDDGTMRSVLQGYYNQSDFHPPAVPSPPASDSGEAADNQSPAKPPAPPPAGAGR